MGKPPEVADSSLLTDADWAELNALWRVYEARGSRAGRLALEELRLANPDRFARIAAALFPDRVREALKDEMAEAGLTMEDIREMLRKAESPARDQ